VPLDNKNDIEMTQEAVPNPEADESAEGEEGGEGGEEAKEGETKQEVDLTTF